MTMAMVPLGTEKMIAGIDRGVGWLTINQPARRNAVSLEMWQGLADACAVFQNDSTVRAVVIQGAGEQSFAAGADISEFEQQRANADQKRRYGEIAARGHKALAALDKPLVAMIRGYCIGGGLAIALTADLRFATPDARFGIPAARLGLGYDYPGVAALARLVGPSCAKDMLFSARQLDAEEALRIGLINRIVEPTAIEATTREYVESVAENAPLTVATAKAALKMFERYTDQAGAADIATLVDRCFDSNDYREGRRAFMEKRTPRFKGE
tara:strand:- start:6637 stop:7446 length:810 start_codon:yes stop_codon:yes gene_type:complete